MTAFGFCLFLEVTSTQSDDADGTPPLLPHPEALVDIQCPSEFHSKCEHNCVLMDDTPTCTCFKGFTMIDGHCQGTIAK